MGVDLGKLIEAETIELKDLSGKKIAIDALNTIYQFLSIIRQPDGTPLMDSKGQVTSHLSGLFYRTLKMMEIGIIPCYVFDGKPPQLKAETIQKRREVREASEIKWHEAKKAGDLETARKFAQAASRVNEQMLDESKELLSALGIPHVQAPSEGESQAAYLCKQGDVYCAGSQDFDSLLFGTPLLARNLAITGKRKVPRQNRYVDVHPEMFHLDEILKKLKINQEQLVEIGIFIGTDFNPGIKGIGPKKALQHVLEKPISAWKNELEFGIDPEEVKKVFLEPEITKDYSLKWGEPDRDKLVEILHERHEFSEERVDNALKKLESTKGARNQKSLDQWS